MASGSFSGGGVSKKTHKWSERPQRPEPSTSLVLKDYRQMIKISLNSISKHEVRNLKRKLTAELEEVRSLINRLEQSDNFAGDVGPVSNKKVKTANGGKNGEAKILKSCNNLLTKLMKHKSGWVFNTPVDAVRLGLHDYHSIVKKPMDLGTVKTRLSKKWYNSPLEFAEDVRLTFNNAMLYNPVGHDVHCMAEDLLNMFEEKWAPLESQYELLNRKEQPVLDSDFHAPVSMNTHNVEPLPLPAPTPSSSPPLTKVDENRTLERAESMIKPVEPAVLTVVPDKPEEEEESGNRDLTFEEKQRLGEDLQDLPYDKLDTVVQIIKESNPELAQQDEEIEFDIGSLDLKTLWEIYRIVNEYKESSSKKKEEQVLGAERDAESIPNSVHEQDTLVTGLEPSKVTELGHVASPAQQEVNADGSSSSDSSSSSSGPSGSGSSESDSESSGPGSDIAS